MLKFYRQAVSSKIGRRLMLSIVLFSSLITLITTALQLFNDYDSELDRIDHTFSNIEKVSLDVLAASIWVIDEHLMDTLLDGFIQLNDINYILVDDQSGQHRSRGTPKDHNVLERIYPLSYNSGNEQVSVGSLTIQADLGAVYGRLYEKAILILLSNAVKTFLVAGMILGLVWLNITRHLNALANYCQNIRVEDDYQPLRFQRADTEDEFEQVAEAINGMQQKLHNSFAAISRSKMALQKALADRERLLTLERSFKEDLEQQVKERTLELEKSLAILKRAQQALVEQEKIAALGGLVSGVAHEINTPIGICLTAASAQRHQVEDIVELLHREDATLEELDQLLDEFRQSGDLIVSNITRASQLIQKFKTIAAEHSQEDQGHIRVAQLCRDTHESVQLMYAPITAELELDADDSLEVESNYQLLHQVLNNLMSNSYVHAFGANRDNRLRVTARSDPEWLSIRLEDNGNGISPEVAERMFEPFYTTRRGGGSTGLGLAAAFNATTLLKGNLRYEGHSSLGGACFMLRIPLHQPHSDPQSNDEAPLGEPS